MNLPSNETFSYALKLLKYYRHLKYITTFLLKPSILNVILLLMIQRHKFHKLLKLEGFFPKNKWLQRHAF